MVNLAQPVMGGLYDTLSEAFGNQIAWLVGHTVIIAVGFGLVTLARNWSQIADGAKLEKRHSVDILLFTIVTGFQIQIYSGDLGWPLFSSILIASTFTISLCWCVKVLN